MDWTKVTKAQINGAAFKSLPKEVRADWLALLGVCMDMETCGVVLGCLGWNDRTWIIATGATGAEIQAVVDHGLAVWRGDDLVVRGYDAESEGHVKALRAISAQGVAAKRNEAARRAGAANEPAGKPDGPKHGVAGAVHHTVDQVVNQKDNQTVHHAVDQTVNRMVQPIGSTDQSREEKRRSGSERDSDARSQEHGARSTEPVVSRSRPVYRPAQIGALTAPFLRVYDAYRNKAGKNAAAEEWHVQAALVGGEEALAAAFAEAWRWQRETHPFNAEARFVPKLETYLAGRMWLDDKPDATSAPAKKPEGPQPGYYAPYTGGDKPRGSPVRSLVAELAEAKAIGGDP